MDGLASQSSLHFTSFIFHWFHSSSFFFATRDTVTGRWALGAAPDLLAGSIDSPRTSTMEKDRPTMCVCVLSCPVQSHHPFCLPTAGPRSRGVPAAS